MPTPAGQLSLYITDVDSKTTIFFFFLTQESTSFRLFEILEIALSAVDEMKIYSWYQQHINASVVCRVL